MTQTGSPDLQNDCITSSCPRQSGVQFTLPAIGVGSLYLWLRTRMAQVIRVISLATATAATFVGRRQMIRLSQSRLVPCCRAWHIEEWRHILLETEVLVWTQAAIRCSPIFIRST